MKKKVMTQKTLKNDERAVSPVIAEILMVAIVVILAAVIAAFVFGVRNPTVTTELYFTNVEMDADDGLRMTTTGSAKTVTGATLKLTATHGVTVTIIGDGSTLNYKVDGTGATNTTAIVGGSLITATAAHCGSPTAETRVTISATDTGTGSLLTEATVITT